MVELVIKSSDTKENRYVKQLYRTYKANHNYTWHYITME